MIIMRHRPEENRQQASSPWAATCGLCGENFSLKPEELPLYFGYPRRPYVCSLCLQLLEEADTAISANGTACQMNDPADCDMNETEEKSNERHDEESEPDEASDDQYEEFCRLLESACQGGGAEGGGRGCIQDEEDGPVLIIHLSLTAWVRLK